MHRISTKSGTKKGRVTPQEEKSAKRRTTFVSVDVCSSLYWEKFKPMLGRRAATAVVNALIALFVEDEDLRQRVKSSDVTIVRAEKRSHVNVATPIYNKFRRLIGNRSPSVVNTALIALFVEDKELRDRVARKIGEMVMNR